MNKKETNALSILLSNRVLEWLEATKIENRINKTDLERRLYSKRFHVYMDKRLLEEAPERGLKPNEYTEVTMVRNHLVRNRKPMQYAQRGIKEGWIVMLNKYKATADGL